MTAEIVHLYSITLYWKKSCFILNKEENSSIKKILYDKNKGPDGVKISEKKDILNDKNLVRLRKFFIESVDEYLKKVLQINDEVFMTHSWVAKSNKNSSHHPHNHKGAFLSCVFYIQCNSGKFIINEDRSSIQSGYDFDYDVIKYNSFNSPSFNFPVKTGDFIIFPGHLRHQTEKNKDNFDRIILGANFFLKGVIGKKHQITSVGNE